MEQKTINRTRSLAGSMRRQEYRRRDASRQGSQALRAWRLLHFPRYFCCSLFFPKL